MNKWFVICSLIFIGGIATSTQCHAHMSGNVGCPPDGWFNVAIAIDPKSLPTGVTGDSVTELDGNTEIYLTNSTDIPLVLNAPDPSKRYYEPYPRPLSVKLLAGELYFCNVQTKPLQCEMKADKEWSYCDVGSTPTNCIKRTHKGGPNAELDTPEIEKAVLAGWVAKDDRPPDVQVPLLRAFQFNALYGDKQLTIKGTVTFSLNEKYDPKAGTRSGCSSL